MLTSQLVFIGFRTVNVKAIADNNLTKALTSGTIVHWAWLVSIGIGGYSMSEIILNFDWSYVPVVICSTVGGLIGTWLGLKTKSNEKTKRR